MSTASIRMSCGLRSYSRAISFKAPTLPHGVFVSTKPRKRPSRVTDLDIGKALRHHRTSRRMTQIQFGALIGVSYQQVGKYENGTDRIAASSAVHLAEQLGISVDD